MAQLTYSYATPVAVAGGIADISDYVIESRANEASDGALYYGMGVVVGTTAGKTVALPSASTDAFEGVVVNGFTTEQSMAGVVTIPNKATVGCMTHGKIWVRVAKSQTVTYNSTAYLYYSGTGAIGCFGASSSNGIPVGTFKSAVTTTTAYDLALVELGYDKDTVPSG